MTIRDAEPKDANQLDGLLTSLIHDETQYDSNLNEACIITDNYCNRIGLDGHKLLLIENEGEIVGYLYGFIYQVPDIWMRPVAILDALYVDEKHRRKGYATLLLSKFKTFAQESGACRIELKVLSRETLNKSSAGFGGSFAPIFAFENLEIHKVFLRFSTQN